MWTLTSARPCRPSTAFAPAVNADRSSVCTMRHKSRARWLSGSVSSGISNRITACRRNGSLVRTRGFVTLMNRSTRSDCETFPSICDLSRVPSSACRQASHARGHANGARGRDRHFWTALQ